MDASPGSPVDASASPAPEPPDLSDAVLFMRRMAHALNNALAAASMNADLLLADLPEDDPRREIAQDIADAARRATELTKELSRYAKEADHNGMQDGPEAGGSESLEG